MAGTAPAVHADFGDGLGRGWLGRGAVHRIGAGACTAWREPGGLLVRRKRARRENSYRPRLPDGTCGARAARSGDPHWSGRRDYLGCAGRAYFANGASRRGFPGAPTAPRPILAAARCGGTGCECFLAGAIPSSGTSERAGANDGRAYPGPLNVTTATAGTPAAL